MRFDFKAYEKVYPAQAAPQTVDTAVDGFNPTAEKAAEMQRITCRVNRTLSRKKLKSRSLIRQVRRIHLRKENDYGKRKSDLSACQ